MGKDFKGKLLTRDDIKRAKKAGLEFLGKIIFKPSSRLEYNKKYTDFIKGSKKVILV